jgi:hypothetical protein
MVSHEQHTLVGRKALGAALLAILGLIGSGAFAAESARKFYPDDPLLREPAPRPVTKVEPRKVDDIYDFLENMYATPRRAEKVVREGPHPARDINTLGDVPDSAWYTNRHFVRRMSLEELQRGPGNTTPPAANEDWLIVGAKSDGVMPGFVIEDGHKNRYMLKFDPPRFPELCSAADVIGSKAFYALGFDTPENYIVHFRRENLKISPGVQWRDPSGKKHPLTERVLDEMLQPQSKTADGTYRGLASRWIAGDIIGPFSYHGMRTDDPNDTVPHEDRRELRGLRVFAAWLNHQDTRSINTMDSLITENGVRYLKHYLLDFGSILGSDGVGPKPTWSGHQYAIDRKGAAFQVVTLGLLPPRWARSDYPNLGGVGLFDSWSFDPVAWKPNYPNPAFLLMDVEDGFWGAKQVASFTDDEIRALVQAGEYSDPRATEWVAECLIKRRDKIAEAWFSQALPLDRFRLVDGALAFDDLAQGRGAAPHEYTLKWVSYDRGGSATPLPDAVGRQAPPLRADTAYLAATIALANAADPCPRPVTVYLRPRSGALEVVGIDR